MPYVGGSLTTLFNEAQRHATRETMRSVVAHGTSTWLKATREYTPIETGELKLGWFQLPVEFRAEGYTGGIGTFVEYAVHVEYGTGLYGPKKAKYPITPKRPGGVLRWYDPKTGKPVFARQVMHPGSPGAHMVSKGGDAMVIALDGLVGPILSAWEGKIVRNAD